MIRACVVGASGYAGAELVDILDRHPAVERVVAMSAREDASAAGSRIVPYDAAAFGEVDVVFTCLPHGVAASVARDAWAAECRIVDLSADFRLSDRPTYERVYGTAHHAPELLPRAVYGLTELSRDALDGARLVANPGCYPTSILLAVRPLLDAGLLDAEQTIVCDAKSGVSGAGRAPTERTTFGSVHENFLAYGVGAHRHTPEIHEHAGTDRLVFVPHLLPVFRGILSTIYVAPAAGVRAVELRGCLAERYAGEPFVRVLPAGVPELRDVQRTNRCHIGLADAGDHVVIVSVIDNLRKGAAGQAAQNMNVLFQRPETEGLT